MHGIWSGGVRAKGRPKKTYTKVVEKDRQTQQPNKEDAMDHSKLTKLTEDKT